MCILLVFEMYTGHCSLPFSSLCPVTYNFALEVQGSFADRKHFLFRPELGILLYMLFRGVCSECEQLDKGQQISLDVLYRRHKPLLCFQSSNPENKAGSYEDRRCTFRTSTSGHLGLAAQRV